MQAWFRSEVTRVYVHRYTGTSAVAAGPEPNESLLTHKDWGPGTRGLCHPGVCSPKCGVGSGGVYECGQNLQPKSGVMAHKEEEEEVGGRIECSKPAWTTQ
jgi:hypothetical protein